MESTWVDLKAVKQSVTMEQILRRYGTKLKKSGKELRGRCPIHQGDGTGGGTNIKIALLFAKSKMAAEGPSSTRLADTTTLVSSTALIIIVWVVYGSCRPAGGEPPTLPHRSVSSSVCGCHSSWLLAVWPARPAG